MKINNKILKIVLLLVGAVAITFSGLNWHNGIAAWIAPIFLLMYTRKAKWYEIIFFFVVMSVSGAISQTCNNLMHIPAVNIFNGLSFGILTSIPYVLDKLLYKKNDRFHYSLIFPASVALIEFVASMAIGTWGSIAHTQYEFKPLMQLSSVTGIYGIWFIISWFASVINWIVENKDKSRVISKGAITFSSILFIVLLFGVIRIKSLSQTDKTTKVAAVLSETEIHQIVAKEAPTFKELAEDNNTKIPARLFSDSLAIERLVNRTGNAAQQGAKIIVWNEIALIMNQAQKKNLISEIQSICSKDEVYVLVAFLEECIEQNKKPFNNISILISPEGEIIWEYKKSFLQPTAEAPIINPGDFELPVVQTPYGKIGNVICVDLDIQNYIKQAGEKSVDILLVPAFDWAEITPLHSQMAGIQAIQFGFSLVRPNGKGLTAIYDYVGNTLASVNNTSAKTHVVSEVVARELQVQGLRSPKNGSLLGVNDQFSDKHNAAIGALAQPLNTLTSDTMIVYADVPTKSVKTIYSGLGDLIIYLAVLFLLFMIAKRFMKKN